MIISRVVPVVRKSLDAVIGRNVQRRLISTSRPRQGHGPYAYRNHPPQDKLLERMADVAGTVTWWWILWHCMTDYHHIIGHFPYPDIDGWTDEELGIPPDDADDP